MDRDLSAEAFVVLRRALFDGDGNPVPFWLRDKRNTQDDPLDEHLIGVLAEELESDSTHVQPSPGPLISPDMALFDRTAVRRRLEGGDPFSREEIVGIESKKLERTATGRVARATGLDFNTTPPSEELIVLGPDDERLIIPGSYLFTILESENDDDQITALVLCDGALLNEDVELYKRIVSVREKEIGLGSYADGVDRKRPMMIFSNPLSVSEFEEIPTLISGDDELESRYGDDLQRVGTVKRTRADGSKGAFSCYRVVEDVDRSSSFELEDPFPEPARTETTQSRGRFRLDL